MPKAKQAKPQQANRLISVPFTVCGPFKTPIKREGKGSISFPSSNVADLFGQSGAKAHADDVGCYVMARKFGDTFTPLYVGQTTRKFALEVFDSDKREKYRLAAKDFPTGQLVLFLLIPDPAHTAGRTNAIRDLEKHLVEEGKKANPKLQNKQLAPKPMFRIEGIHGAAQGQPRKEIQQFRNMMGW